MSMLKAKLQQLQQDCPPAPAVTLWSLLYARRDEYNDDAVRVLLQGNPVAANHCGYHPLHQALKNGASAATVRLLCDACPEFATRKDDRGDTALHIACSSSATSDVVHLLCDRNAEAVASKNSEDMTPLHVACSTESGPSLEVVKYLANACPAALAAKGPGGVTPLAMACTYRPSNGDLLVFLTEKYAQAAKRADNHALYPLHRACAHGVSLRNISLIIDQYPIALESKTKYSRDTPLHLACKHGAPLEVVQLLIERCPKALEMQDWDSHRPWQCAMEWARAPSEVVKILSSLHCLTSMTENDPQVVTSLQHFQDIHWPGGVALVLDAFPSVVNTIDHCLFPTILSLVGKRCSLSTFYAMLQDNPTLMKGAIKTYTRPSSKRFRK